MKILIAIMLLLASMRCQAAIIMAHSPSQLDVSNAVQSAVSGDTVAIPAGTGHWTNTLIIFNKAINIIGSGIGQTVMVDDLSNNSDDSQRSIFRCDIYGSNKFRISGMSFVRGNQSFESGKGIIWNSGTSRAFRVDHCSFDKLRNLSIFWSGQACGVVDHCSFGLHPDGGARPFHASDTEHGSWPPDTSGIYGDGSWASPAPLGTTNAVVFEDNYFFKTPDGTAAIDCFGGAHVVVRYNIFTNCYVASHGTDSSGRQRGGRSLEVYGNQFWGGLGQTYTPVDVRSGSCVSFSNIFSGYTITTSLTAQRQDYISGPYGYADGNSPWDVNSNGIYASGTHQGATLALALSDTNSTWTSGQWNGFSIRNLDTSISARVVGTATHTLTLWPSDNISTPISFADGQHYEIRLVDTVLDGPGMGSGTLFTGGFNTPSPVGWPHQTNDPVYAWSNSMINVQSGGGDFISNNGYHPIMAGREYFDHTPKPGGYVPLIYPHPLVSGSTNTPPPTPPASVTLRIVSYQGRVLTSVGKQ